MTDTATRMAAVMAAKAAEQGFCSRADLHRAGFNGHAIDTHGDAARAIAEARLADPAAHARTLVADQAAEAAALAREAVDQARAGRHDHAHVTAMWAGICGRKAGLNEADNPMPDEMAALRAAWGRGYAMGMKAPLARPKPTLAVSNRPAPHTTHASATHDALG